MNYFRDLRGSKYFESSHKACKNSFYFYLFRVFKGGHNSGQLPNIDEMELAIIWEHQFSVKIKGEVKTSTATQLMLVLILG